MRKLLPDPFLVLLILMVGLASVLPARGAWATIIGWIATAAVFLLFFFHGAKLERHQIVAGFTNWRLHLAIMATTFVMFPLAGWGASRILAGQLPPELTLGILFLAALPSTVQSAIAFVGIARGNIPAAIAAASASQMLGIFITPLLVSALIGSRLAGNGLQGVGEVAAQIFLPFVLGQLCRPLIKGWMEKRKRLVRMTDQSTILIAVYSAFSAAVINGVWTKLPLGALLTLVAVCCGLLLLGLAFTWGLGALFRFSREDRIALLFCGTKKSLVQGVPMAKALFPAATAGVVLIPIMLFHQIQLMACAFIARSFAQAEREALESGQSLRPNPQS